MPDYAVRTDFLGRDKSISDTFERMGRSADRFSNQASSAFSRVSSEADRASSSMRNSTKAGYKFGAIVKGILAANAIRGGIGMIGSGIHKLGEDFLGFDDTMVSAAAKFDDVGMTAKNFGGTLDQLKQKWSSFAKGSRFSALEVAKSGEIMAESGWRSDVAAGVTPYLLKAARANRVTDLSEFTDSMVGIFQGFGLKTNDATKDSSRFVTILDQITQGAVDARGGITDLKEALKVLAPVWQESESSAATIAFASTLQNAGFPGDMVATAGKNAKLRLSRPDIVANLMANGIDVKDPNTGMIKKNVQLYEEISARMKKVGIKPGSPDDIAVNTMLFGSYALAGNKSMLQHLQEYRREIERVETGSKNVAGNTSDLISQYSTLDKVITLVGVTMNKGFQILERFNGPGQKGIEGLTNKIRNFKVEPIVEGLTAIGKTVGLLYTMVEPFLPALPYIVAGFVAWNAALKIATMMKWGFMIGAFLTDTIAILGPLNMMTVLVKTLTVAMSALAVPFASVAAAFSVITAGYSLVTGKDNMISRFAQDIGLVPKLDTDANGKVVETHDAPNKKEAEARRIQFQGQLNIAGAPAGSTVESRTTGAPSFDLNLLGAQ